MKGYEMDIEKLKKGLSDHPQVKAVLRRQNEEVEIEEAFSSKEVKMAIGVASDPRYKKGNMTGAVQAIEKIKKGLSDHPQVAAVLKRQNEEVVAEAENPCWEGYEMVGMKMKDGKEVPNCVPISEAGYNDQPETEAEADKKYPDTETDVKNKNHPDLQKVKVSEAYAN